MRLSSVFPRNLFLLRAGSPRRVWQKYARGACETSLREGGEKEEAHRFLIARRRVRVIAAPSSPRSDRLIRNKNTREVNWTNDWLRKGKERSLFAERSAIARNYRRARPRLLHNNMNKRSRKRGFLENAIPDESSIKDARLFLAFSNRPRRYVSRCRFIFGRPIESCRTPCGIKKDVKSVRRSKNVPVSVKGGCSLPDFNGQMIPEGNRFPTIFNDSP